MAATNYQDFFKEADENADDSVPTSGPPFWTPLSGGAKWHTSRIRILPPPADKSDSLFFTWVPTHGSLPGSQRPVLCPFKFNGEWCPSCEKAQFLSQTSKEAALKWWPSWKAMVNVVLMDKTGSHPIDPKTEDELGEVKPLLWSLSKRSMEDLKSKIAEIKEAGGDSRITSPKYGRDIYVRRTGTGVTDTRYEVTPAPAANQMPQWMFPALEKMHSLETLKTYELLPGTTIARLMSPNTQGGQGIDDDDDQQAEDEPIWTPVANIPEPKAATAPDDLPWDDDEEDGPTDVVDGIFDEDPEPVAEVSLPPAKSRMDEARKKLHAKLGA